MSLPILPPCNRRASALSISCSTGFSLQSGDTPAQARYSFIRGVLFRHSGNVLVFGDETRMNHLVRIDNPIVDVCPRHQYRCRSQDPAATSLVFMTRGERSARSSKFYPGAL